MIEFLSKLFLSDFMGHGYCYLWKPEIVRLHAVSDGLIALSYYFIPLMLAYLVRKRRDLPFHWMFFMFGVFILGCGTTHLMEIWTLWHGTYRLAGVIKAITAGASLATAVALVPLVPKALQLPSPAQLQAANEGLEKEVTERRHAEEALQAERNFVSAVLNTVDTIILTLDLEGRIVQCNSACEHFSGATAASLAGQHLDSLFHLPEEGEQLAQLVLQAQDGQPLSPFEGCWTSPDGAVHIISWTATTLSDRSGTLRHVIAAGVDLTESKRLQKAVLDISAREQRRIGQDLHDGLGQQLTGIAFMSKVLAQELHRRQEFEIEAAEASNIVNLVNEAISKTRELSRGLLPVESDDLGLMTALERRAAEAERLFGIRCRFDCPEPVHVYDVHVATHLYRIAQEAISNAIKHGHASSIEICLRNGPYGRVMYIRDNGTGMPRLPRRSHTGLGLQIMNYRAKMIGATLAIGPNGAQGTVVTCQLRPGLSHAEDAPA